MFPTAIAVALTPAARSIVADDLFCRSLYPYHKDHFLGVAAT
jgi:hypothetical protein